MVMQRTLMEAEHDLFRSSFRAFVEREVVPHHARWEADGIVPRELWLSAGRSGFLGIGIPEEHGGSGVDDFRYNVVMQEELTRVGASGVGFPLHNDVVAPYLLALATEEQRRRWLPGFCAGELITAIAMSEPGAGSDLQGVRTTATPNADGWVLNGQKTFITNGINADLVIVVARTDPDAGHRGISLLMVERGMPGFERGRNLDKIGLHAQDTAELFFSDVHVPRTNLLGIEGGGFGHLMDNLPQERLTIAVSAVAGAETALAQTIQYCRERHAFGQPIGSFQHNRFLMAEMATEVEVARVFLDRCIAEHCAGRLGVPEAAMAKWWTTELQKRVMDSCVQLHGGYGYMLEYPIARAYLDSRVQTIFGGTTEIMKEIIGRSMGF
jgi:alkylation response protein AidB-like acyl-CoA dehydrogenase